MKAILLLWALVIRCAPEMALAQERFQWVPISQIESAQWDAGTQALQLRGHLIYPDGCRRIANTYGSWDSEHKILSLSHLTQVTADRCVQVMVPKMFAVSINAVALPGHFQIEDAITGVMLGEGSLQNDRFSFRSYLNLTSWQQ